MRNAVKIGPMIWLTQCIHCTLVPEMGIRGGGDYTAKLPVCSESAQIGREGRGAQHNKFRLKGPTKGRYMCIGISQISRIYAE